ncbi:MAG: FxLYD domain-containing protein [Candidatus Methanomethyliaceae archaeon]
MTSVQGYRSTQGSLEVVGLVTNRSESGVSFVQLEIEVLDANENSLYKGNAFAILEYLAPGESSPFALSIPEELPQAQRYRAAVVGYHPDVIERATVSLEHARLVVDDHGDIFITGALVNRNDYAVIVNSLGAATFDQSGQMVTAGTHSVLMRYLAPGQTGFFRVMMNGPQAGTDQIVQHTVYIDAQRSELQAEIPFTIVSSRDYLDLLGNFHLVGEATNRSESPYKINLLAAIYDAEGNVLDASDLGLPFAALKPGESVPFDFSHWGPLNTKEGWLETADHFVVYIDYYWTWVPTGEVFELTLEEQREEFGANEATFRGKVINNTGSPLGSATVVVALRDIQQGKVMATNYNFVYEELAVGAAYEYTVTIPLWDGFDRNAVQAVYYARGMP